MGDTGGGAEDWRRAGRAWRSWQIRSIIAVVGLSGSVGSTVGEEALQGGTVGKGSPRWGGASAAGGGGISVPLWMSGMMIG